VLWASAGRSSATAERAREAGLDDVGSVEELASRCDLILSVCPPHAAVDLARTLRGFPGIYVDANAISPATAQTVGALVRRYVDGGIIGSPPRGAGTTRLYLSGGEAKVVADLFAPTILDAVVVSEDPCAASAVKMAFAAWTKGTAALLLAIRALARTEGVEQALLAEWRLSLPHLSEQSAAAARSAATKGWRWVGEMNQIAATFAAAGLPEGFHRAAAEIYERSPPEHGSSDNDLECVLSALQPQPSNPTSRPDSGAVGSPD
jgi:3-hydroxyisobutyrate dehydrogenase-like beta-hydroxyacid dehydrogenase